MNSDSRKRIDVKALTVNVAGGKPANERKPGKLGDFIKDKDFDFVCCQESSEACYDSGDNVSVLEEICQYAGEKKYSAYFIPAVDTARHPCPEYVPDTQSDGSPARRGKWYSSRFISDSKGVNYAAQGNGFLLSNRWEIVDLFGGTWQGTVATTVISDFALFLGDRESEPRIFSVFRAKHKELGFECFVGNTHLTTYRKDNEESYGSQTRSAQVHRILQACNVLSERIPIIMAGDFNAELSSPEMNLLTEMGFIAATDKCSDAEKGAGTHRRNKLFVDHIFYSSNANVRFGSCSVVDLGVKVTDHNPVIFTFSLHAKR